MNSLTSFFSHNSYSSSHISQTFGYIWGLLKKNSTNEVSLRIICTYKSFDCESLRSCVHQAVNLRIYLHLTVLLATKTAIELVGHLCFALVNVLKVVFRYLSFVAR